MSINSRSEIDHTSAGQLFETPQAPSRFSVYVSRLAHSPLMMSLLFLAALWPRLPGLSRFLTSDERTNIFLAGSDVITAFLAGDWRGTYWHFYPGVTMSWLDALGMGGQYLLDLWAGKALPPFQEYVYGDILSLLVASRLPYAILTAAAVPVSFLLMRKLLPDRVAILGALFMAFDPFYLAHSRLAHGDAPVAVFMSLATLTFFIFIQRRFNKNLEGEACLAQTRVCTPPMKPASFDTAAPTQDAAATSLPGFVGAYSCRAIVTIYRGVTCRLGRSFDLYLVASAICGSLAALTKAPGQFMALFVIALSGFYAGLEIWQVRQKRSAQPESCPLPFTFYFLRFTTPWLGVIAVWSIISAGVFILLWPAMWSDPVGIIRQLLAETLGKVNEGHLVYFLGQPTLDPGVWFYFYVIPFRLTPVVLIGSLISLFFFIPKAYRRPVIQRVVNPHTQDFVRSPHFLLWLFIVTLLLFGNLSSKKQDRYLLPLFPFLDFLAAVGWTGLVAMINEQLSMINNRLRRFNFARPGLRRTLRSHPGKIGDLIQMILLLLHFIPVLSYYPYYLTYFNPLLGGPKQAARTTLMGWGEGMEQVADYLNAKPGAEKLYVASTPSQTLLPYFAGTGENFYTNDIAFRADYVVLYLAQMQRLAPSPEIVRYFESQEAEKVITIHDVAYAKIYPGPKLVLRDIPPQARPINIGLDDLIRLAGYEVEVLPELRRLELTLYWHALASVSANYTISVRARADDGRILAQQDQWPVEGLLPTSQWRQGDYVVDRHTLDLPALNISEIDSFEVVVYNAETHETLGPPLQLVINNE